MVYMVYICIYTALQEYHVGSADIVNSRFEEAHPIPDDYKDFDDDKDFCKW